MKNVLLFVLTISLVAMSCEAVKNNNEEIHGKWQAISWKAAGVETLGDDAKVTFEFNVDDNYVAASGSSEEAGIYRLEKDKLYTTAKGQIEKMVKVELMSADTMKMDMNRVGTAEVMILVRQE